MVDTHHITQMDNRAPVKKTGVRMEIREEHKKEVETSCYCLVLRLLQWIVWSCFFHLWHTRQTSFYSRPLKITGTSVSSQKENKERWGIILNHFLSTNHPMLAANQRKKEVWFWRTYYFHGPFTICCSLSSCLLWLLSKRFSPILLQKKVLRIQ